MVHLARRSGRHSPACAPILKAVLCDGQFVKVGCGIDEDLMALHNLWNGGLDAKSRLDFGLMGASNNRYGLKTLSRRLLGLNLPKPKRLALSDWSAVPLTNEQIVYGARDAWAGAAIAHKLAEKDPEMFSYESLVASLPSLETPIPQLAAKQERRRKAKQLLQLYRNAELEYLPDNVVSHVLELRTIARSPVMPRDSNFEIDHLL